MVNIVNFIDNCRYDIILSIGLAICTALILAISNIYNVISIKYSLYNIYPINVNNTT